MEEDEVYFWLVMRYKFQNRYKLVKILLHIIKNACPLDIASDYRHFSLQNYLYILFYSSLYQKQLLPTTVI